MYNTNKVPRARENVFVITGVCYTREVFVVVHVSRTCEGKGSNFKAVFKFFSKMCITAPAGGTDHGKKANFQTHLIFKLVYQDKSVNLSYSNLARL